MSDNIDLEVVCPVWVSVCARLAHSVLHTQVALYKNFSFRFISLLLLLVFFVAYREFRSLVAYTISACRSLLSPYFYRRKNEK